MPLAIHPLGINRPLWELARVDLDEANTLRILRIPQGASPSMTATRPL
uniref:Thermonuclease n=1 Tax=Rhizobium meliloti TaxID=382 RepID=I2E260_RHIML|nr:thermonuclease [Sinorhizobium meliloti]